MADWLYIKSDKIKPFRVDDTYTSKMLLDNDFFPEGDVNTIQINLGEFAPNAYPEKPVEGATHTADEVYYILYGKAEIQIDNDKIIVEEGDVVFIPAGAYHAVKNLSSEEPFRLLTFWRDGRHNELYHARKAKWGKVFRTTDESGGET